MKLTTRNATQIKRMYIQIDLVFVVFSQFRRNEHERMGPHKDFWNRPVSTLQPSKAYHSKIDTPMFQFLPPKIPISSSGKRKKKMENTTKARYVKHQSSFSINKNIFILNHSPQERFVKVHTFAQLSQSSHLLDFLHNFPLPFEPILNWFIFVHL